MKRPILVCVALSLLASCAGSSNNAPHVGDVADAIEMFDRASGLALAGNLDEAFSSLEGSLRAGYPTPSDVMSSPEWLRLLDAPEWRPRVWDLLETNARETSITIFRPEEAGEPMVLTMRIVGGHGEPPRAVEPPVRRADVMLGVTQVDAAGYYQKWSKNEGWNPRHFGFAVTDETGTVVVRTIRPGYYAPEYEAPDEPAHVHYNVTCEGVLLRASEFYFEDDPRLAGDARRIVEENRVPIASVTRDDDGVWQAEVTIPVRGLR